MTRSSSRQWTILASRSSRSATTTWKSRFDPASRFGSHPSRSIADSVSIEQFLGSWSLHVESWTHAPNPSLHVIRYEDLLTKPMTAFKGVAEFLGLDPPRERLTRAIEFSSFDILHEQEQRHGFRESSTFAKAFFHSGTAGQWRKILSAAQVDAVLGVHRETMERFGYVPT